MNALHATGPLLHRHFISTSRGLVHCQEAGSGDKVIVLVTITSFGNTIVNEVLEDLASRGYRAMALDLMGYGNSDRRTCQWKIEDFADNIAEALSVLEVTPTVLSCGHFSSWIGIELAGRPGGNKMRLVLDGTPMTTPESREMFKTNACKSPRAWNAQGTQTGEYWKTAWHIISTLNPGLSLETSPSPLVREAYLAVLGTLSFEPGTAYAAAEFQLDAKLALVHSQTVAMCSDHDWNLPHFPNLLDGLANAEVETLRWSGVHPLHDLQDRSRTGAYADVLDRLARDGVQPTVGQTATTE